MGHVETDARDLQILANALVLLRKCGPTVEFARVTFQRRPRNTADTVGQVVATEQRSALILQQEVLDGRCGRWCARIPSCPAVHDAIAKLARRLTFVRGPSGNRIDSYKNGAVTRRHRIQLDERQPDLALGLRVPGENRPTTRAMSGHIAVSSG